MKQHMIVSSQHRKPKSDHPNENGQLHCNIITARPGGEVRKYMKRCDFSKTTAKKKHDLDGIWVVVQNVVYDDDDDDAG